MKTKNLSTVSEELIEMITNGASNSDVMQYIKDFVTAEDPVSEVYRIETRIKCLEIARSFNPIGVTELQKQAEELYVFATKTK